MRKILEHGFEELGLTPPPRAVEQLEQYANMLVEQNQVMNLTAITQLDEVARLHFLDCAALVDALPEEEGITLIDVGTGAGFPGLVLKILRPDLKLTLLDSLAKRLDWLDEVCQALGLEQVTTIHARGEEGAHQPVLREAFQVATARAVAELPILSELCLPYVAVGGKFLAMKAAGSQEEQTKSQSAIALLGGAVQPERTYQIPGTDITRRVIVVEKTAATPEKYPRRWAKMQKSPLV